MRLSWAGGVASGRGALSVGRCSGTATQQSGFPTSLHHHHHIFRLHLLHQLHHHILRFGGNSLEAKMKALDRAIDIITMLSQTFGEMNAHHNGAVRWQTGTSKPLL